MVETKKKIRTPLNTQPIQPIIDVSFWQHFTKQKLDHWRLKAPQIEITGQVSLPNNINNPSDIVFTSQSFPDQIRKKVTGGLISFLTPGLLCHTNTIEEFESFDIEQVVEQERSKVVNKLSEI